MLLKWGRKIQIFKIKLSNKMIKYNFCFRLDEEKEDKPCNNSLLKTNGSLQNLQWNKGK